MLVEHDTSEPGCRRQSFVAKTKYYTSRHLGGVECLRCQPIRLSQAKPEVAHCSLDHTTGTWQVAFDF